MSKIQKIWLLVLIVLFFLPEILWSPMVNFLYSFFMPTVHGSSPVWRNNYLLDSQNLSLYEFTLLVQMISVIVFTILWARSKSKLESKIFYWSILTSGILLSLLSIFIGYLVCAVGSISF